MVSSGHDLSGGLQLSAWLGLVPGRAQAVLNAAKGKTDSISRWAVVLSASLGLALSCAANEGG